MGKDRIITAAHFTDENGETTTIDSGIDWAMIRWERDLELKETDWWALKDLTMSQAKKDYRTFLRNLPQTYATPEEAQAAWLAYEIPE